MELYYIQYTFGIMIPNIWEKNNKHNSVHDIFPIFRSIISETLAGLFPNTSIAMKT